MNGDAIELAKRALGDNSELHSPRHEAIAFELLGGLSITGREVAEQHRAEAERKTNSWLISRFVEALPCTGNNFDERSSITTSGPEEAAQVQAHVIWFQELLKGTWNLGVHLEQRPYYIIGEASPTSGRGTRRSSGPTDLLIELAGGFVRFGSARLVRVWSDELALARRLARVPLSIGFTTQEIGTMRVPGSQKMRLSFGDSPLTTRISNSDRLRRFRPVGDLLKRTPTKGIHAQTLELPHLDGPNDADLARFDVLTHLFRLATAFSKQRELYQLLDGYTAQLEGYLA